MRSFTIGENDAGQRLDKFLKKAVPLLPASLLYKAVRTKRIKLGGKRCQIGDKLAVGDVLELYLSDEFFTPRALPFLAAPAALSVLYEDDNLLLLDKPAGLLVHEDAEEQNDTLIHRVQHYLYDKGEYRPEDENSFAPALCNRIDRNTGGIVIAAKTFEALQILDEKIRQREVSKLYLCLVHGVPEKASFLLRGYHHKDERTKTVRIEPHPFPGGKTALTGYRVLASKGGVSLLEVELFTGRTHQIRAHLASIGHPIVGDAKYGLNARNKNTGWKHQALSAYKLAFPFPTDAGILSYLTGQAFTIRPLPFRDLFPNIDKLV